MADLKKVLGRRGGFGVGGAKSQNPGDAKAHEGDDRIIFQPVGGAGGGPGRSSVNAHKMAVASSHLMAVGKQNSIGSSQVAVGKKNGTGSSQVAVGKKNSSGSSQTFGGSIGIVQALTQSSGICSIVVSPSLKHSTVRPKEICTDLVGVRPDFTASGMVSAMTTTSPAGRKSLGIGSANSSNATPTAASFPSTNVTPSTVAPILLHSPPRDESINAQMRGIMIKQKKPVKEVRTMELAKRSTVANDTPGTWVASGENVAAGNAPTDNGPTGRVPAGVGSMVPTGSGSTYGSGFLNQMTKSGDGEIAKRSTWSRPGVQGGDRNGTSTGIQVKVTASAMIGMSKHCTTPTGNGPPMGEQAATSSTEMESALEMSSHMTSTLEGFGDGNKLGSTTSPALHLSIDDGANGLGIGTSGSNLSPKTRSPRFNLPCFACMRFALCGSTLSLELSKAIEDSGGTIVAGIISENGNPRFSNRDARKKMSRAPPTHIIVGEKASVAEVKKWCAQFRNASAVTQHFIRHALETNTSPDESNFIPTQMLPPDMQSNNHPQGSSNPQDTCGNRQQQQQGVSGQQSSTRSGGKNTVTHIPADRLGVQGAIQIQNGLPYAIPTIGSANCAIGSEHESANILSVTAQTPQKPNSPAIRVSTGPTINFIGLDFKPETSNPLDQKLQSVSPTRRQSVGSSPALEAGAVPPAGTNLSTDIAVNNAFSRRLSSNNTVAMSGGFVNKNALQVKPGGTRKSSLIEKTTISGKTAPTAGNANRNAPPTDGISTSVSPAVPGVRASMVSTIVPPGARASLVSPTFPDPSTLPSTSVVNLTTSPPRNPSDGQELTVNSTQSILTDAPTVAVDTQVPTIVAPVHLVPGKVSKSGAVSRNQQKKNKRPAPRNYVIDDF